MHCTSRIKGLTFTIKRGTKEAKTVPDCSIKFLDKCFRIEKVDYPTASSVTAAISAGGGTSATAEDSRRGNAKSVAVESAADTRMRTTRFCAMSVTLAII